MGRSYIEGVLETKGMKQETALTIHLLNNHYPPVNLVFLSTCRKAINYAKKGNKLWEKGLEDEARALFNKEIKMPNGKTLTVTRIIEGLHLDSFLEY